MKRTLGLDLGTNSLGWAILDDITGDILDKGVVIFPEGTDLDAGTSLETPAATRRAARMARRMKFRRKLRKWHLLSILIDAGMCPLTHAELDDWKKYGTYPLGNRAFLDWLKATDASNPYCDRAAAAEKKVPPFTLGRALYHLAQRRGFKSSRKDEAAQIDAETGELKAPDKETGKVKGDIATLSAEIAAAGCQTLGQYFHLCLERQKSARVKTRIRCRYTGRVEHYMEEFRVIMDKQELSDAPDASGKSLRGRLYDAIFMQRPLRSQKHLVGACPLEPRNPRAQIGHPAFEEFRMLAFINNLALEKADEDYRDENGNLRYPLTPADRARIASAFMKAAGSIKFSDISKLFKKDPRFVHDGLRFHYYRDGDSVATCQTRHRIQSAFGDIPYDEQTVFDALTFFDDSDKLRTWFARHYPTLDTAAITRLVAIHPKEGNAQYSLKAINRILPFLRKGYELSFARFLAKLPDIIPDFAAHETEIIDHLNCLRFECRRDKSAYAELPSQIRAKTPTPPTLYERYETYLRDAFNVDPQHWNMLYLRGDATYVPETEYRANGQTVKLDHPRLPPVQLGMIRNPLVQRAMTTLRRLVNYLGEHGKLDPADTIRIELARDVNDFATRKAWQIWQKSRADLREKAAAEIQQAGKAVTEDAIERYLLWQEQGHICLYTGKSISLQELLAGNAFDVEHTLPRSLSGDDSLANKTICEATYNRQVKQGRVPRDCPNFDEIAVRLRAWREKLEDLEKNYRNQNRKCKGVSDPAAHSAARIKALVTRFERDYWRDKIRRFDIEASKLEVRAGELGGFKKRQLVDTGIMSSHAVELLKSIYPATFSVNGSATAFARKAWGIQDEGPKDRTEHTHHAKDAMVIAALTPARFTSICTALKDDGSQRLRECDVCPSPYPDFAEKVRCATEEILVKHVLRQTTLRQSSKRNVLAKSHPDSHDPSKTVSAVLSRGDTVRGPLHKDTFYGCITDPASGELKKVVRKPLTGPIKDVESLVDKIVDAAIRELVKRSVAALKATGVKNIEAGMIKMPSGVPVNKVRVYAPNAANAQTLRAHTMPSAKDYKTPYYVTSAEGSNFRLALFDLNGEKFVKPDNSLVWAQNHKRPDYVPLDQQPGFVGYIMPGSMALTYHEGDSDELPTLVAEQNDRELSKRLYKVVKFKNDGRITFRQHTEARASVVLAQALKASGKHAEGESKIIFDNPHELLCVRPSTYIPQMLFEGIHFKMNLDGSIQFLER